MKSISPEKLKARILAKVIVDPDTACWEWQGALSDHGYGSITVTGFNGKGRTSCKPHPLVLAT
jgi:hypothetical protein